MLFDTHAHLYDEKFQYDRDEMLAHIFQTVEYVVVPGEDIATSAAALALAQAHPQLYCAVGFHPHLAKNMNEEAFAQLETWTATEEKVVAVGEIGLDYYYDNSPREVQREVFARQIRLAKTRRLPVIIHDREAHGDVMAILREERDPSLFGILHCYSGSYEMATELIDMGFYISFAGPVVFPKSTKLKDVAARLPLDKLLIETDSPYLTPPPYRGRRNDPSRVYYVAEELARLHEVPVDDVIRITNANAKAVYGIA